MLWENLFTNGLVLFIIEKSTNHLCGYLELKSPASDMPKVYVYELDKDKIRKMGKQ